MLKMGIFISVAVGCGCSSFIFARQFLQTLASGEWRGRTGVRQPPDLANIVSEFRGCLLGFYAMLFMTAAICLLGAAVFSTALFIRSLSLYQSLTRTTKMIRTPLVARTW